MGTRSSTQARSHAQKFFVKLEKKQMTMESFLESLDMSNLKSIIENDSDYADEVEPNDGNEKMSQSATSVQYSYSVKSNNIKSPKYKYKKPKFHI